MENTEKCVCCKREASYSVILKADNHLHSKISPSMKKYPIDDPEKGRHYQLFICRTCSLHYHNNKSGSLKDILYSNLLKKAANIPFS
jgi:hypothetical protein